MADADVLESISIRFECAALGGAAVVVEHMDAAEALDEPYSIEVLVKIDDAHADVLALLGEDCVLVVERRPLARRFCGLVRTVWEGDVGSDFVRARLSIAPALAMLGLRRNTRMFQGKTVPEILEDVLGGGLGDYGRSVRSEVEASYPAREYCMQYQETDLDFAQRLMEEEGIHYAFDHAGDTEALVFGDRNSHFAALDTITDTIELVPTSAHARDKEVIHQLVRVHRHTVTSVALRDFDWTSPDFLVEDEVRGTDDHDRDRESYEHGLGRTLTLSDYSSGAKRYQKRDAPQQKQLRLESHQRDGLLAIGLGRVVGLTPGVTFELAGHPTVGMDGKYVVTRVVHMNRAAEGALGVPSSGDSEQYQNRFECIPFDVPYRPRRGRTAKPVVPSIQTAVVTGPSGEEIHTDEHGRIKVRFHWDRENPADDTSSCWIRCEQAWAGAQWGFFWLPRVGMEVVVHFIDGDPDRPIVTGCVYNGENALPYAMPDEKTKSTIKSNSSPGGGGFNELRFEDCAGAEEIYTHAQKDYNEVVLNDHTTTVGHDQTITVDNNQIQHVKVNQTENVDANQRLSVGGNRTVHVKGDFDETVDGTENRTVTGDVTETFDANETRTIAANVDETIGANETRTIGGNHDETIGASHTLDIGAASTRTIAGSFTETVQGGITTTTSGGYTILAAGGVDVTAAGGITMTAPAGVKLIAPGGVTWIDKEVDWFGAAFLEAKLNASEDFVGFKMEVGTTQFSAMGVKFEVAQLEVANQGNGSVNAGARLVTRGLIARAGALGKRAAGFILKGG